MRRNKVLIVTHDTVAEQMAGPAIRCWEVARQLSRTCDVVLTAKQPVARKHAEFEVITFDSNPEVLRQQAEAADILIVQGVTLTMYPAITQLGKYIVVDVYDPFVFESYDFFNKQGSARDLVYLQYVDVLNEQLALGDFFVCANSRQRDLWLGALGALGRLGPAVEERDPSMRNLLELVPFGIQDEAPAAEKPVLRGVVPGIGHDDFVLLWGGGVYDWFDPLSIIRAVAELSKTRDDIKLFFLGIKHPNPEVPEFDMTRRALDLAQELGVMDTHVFFNRGWVDYKERQGFLLEASAGVSSHFDTVETRFAFRTRVLDYLWAGLPVLTSAGDDFAELVERERLGAVIPYGDAAGWKEAIVALADDPARVEATKQRVEAVAERFRWSRVVAPLEKYCQEPYRTPRLFPHLHFRHFPVHRAALNGDPQHRATRRKDLIRKALRILREEGSLVLVNKAIAYLRR